MLALFLGLLSLAAVATAKVECNNEYLTADDGVMRLAADDGALLTTGRQQCRAKFGGFRVAVPPSVAHAIFTLVSR